MFEQLSADIVALLMGCEAFTNVMVRSGKPYLFPMVASEENGLPLTTYALGEKKPGTKDLNEISFAICFWFGIESYTACCQLTDAIEEYLEESDFIVQNSKVEFEFESKCYMGVINVSLI